MCVYARAFVYLQLDTFCDCMHGIFVYVKSLVPWSIFRVLICLKLCYVENKGNLIHYSEREISERGRVQ